MSALVKNSQVVGTSEMARMYRKSRDWARGRLLRWYEEQLSGGEVKVIPTFDRRNRLVLHTTMAILARDLPQARDQALIRKVNALEKDVTNLARRLDRVLDEKRDLERRVIQLERSQPGLARRLHV